MIFKDYYKILGLESNKVSLEQIKNAYREKAKKFHPDINVGDSAAEAIFKDVNEAYKVLSDSAQRRKYDFKWNKYIGSRKKKTQKQKKTFKEMLMDILFGGISKTKEEKKNVPEYGEDIETQIDVSLNEGFFGVNKKIVLKAVNGKETSFSVKVPAGVQNNDKLRIVGQGKKGKNGGKNGDLLVRVNIKDDNKYRLVGTDIYTEIAITVWEAVLGTKKKVDLFGEEINVIIPKCSSSGKKLTIKEKGYKDGKGKRGNLNIVTKIYVPEKLTEKQEKIYQELRNIDKEAV